MLDYNQITFVLYAVLGALTFWAMTRKQGPMWLLVIVSGCAGLAINPFFFVVTALALLATDRVIP